MAFNTLPAILQKEVRDVIKTQCFWNSDSQFYNRQTGRVKIRDYEAIQIINIFRQYGVDAFTGKILGFNGQNYHKSA